MGLEMELVDQLEVMDSSSMSFFRCKIPIKVYMKRNQFFNILKVQHFKDTIPKFEPCLEKIGDYITPENCAILLSKMVFESRSQNVSMT